MMNESIEERMGKYLAGEAGKYEREALDMEMESDPALRAQFQTLQIIWQNTQPETDTHWDVEKGWQTFVEKRESTPIRRISRTRSLKWAIAAAIIISIGGMFLLWNDRKPVDYAYDPNNINPLVLSDGSKIYLNRDASVTVHSFKRKKRLVALRGEAYFEVSPFVNKPFLVEAGGTVTEIVGTAFNIDQTKDQTSIFVSKGKVIFRSQKDQDVAVALTSGEAAVFHNNQLDRVVNPSPNIHAWHSKELSFLNMPLADVIADVASYFDQVISIENEDIKNCRISIPLPFKEPEINSVLNAVSESINASLFMDGKKCIIKGGICPF